LDDGAFVAEPGGSEAEVTSEMGEILAADVAQFDALEVVPDALVGVEVRGVAGELFQADVRAPPWARKSLTGWPRWIGAPSQMTRILPGM